MILLPDCDRKTSRLALLYLDEILESRGYKNVVLMTCDPTVEKCVALFSQSILRVVEVSWESGEHHMQLYCPHEFDKSIICVSLDKPSGRD